MHLIKCHQDTYSVYKPLPRLTATTNLFSNELSLQFCVITKTQSSGLTYICLDQGIHE